MHILAPQDIQMFVTGQPLLLRVVRQLRKQHLNINEGVLIAPEEHDRTRDIPRREPHGAVRGVNAPLGGGPDGRDAREGERVVVHLEARVAHDLEPVHDGLDGRSGVEVRVCRELLRGRDVDAVPREEEGKRGVDDRGEDRRVEDLAPGGGGTENGFAAKEEEEQGRAGLHQRVDNRRCEPRRAHRGRERDEDVHFLV